MALEMAEDLGSKIQLVLQKLSSLESMVQRVLQKFNVLESSVKTIEGEIATHSAKTSAVEKLVGVMDNSLKFLNSEIEELKLKVKESERERLNLSATAFSTKTSIAVGRICASSTFRSPPTQLKRAKKNLFIDLWRGN